MIMFIKLESPPLSFSTTQECEMVRPIMEFALESLSEIGLRHHFLLAVFGSFAVICSISRRMKAPNSSRVVARTILG